MFKSNVNVPIALNSDVQFAFCEPIVPALDPDVPPLLAPVNNTLPPALKNPLQCASLLNVNVNIWSIAGVPELPHPVVLELEPEESVVKLPLGTSASKGFYELSTSNQQLYIKYGSGAYASNYYRIEGKVNSTTNPTVLTFTVTMRDDHALGDGIGADGIDGNSDDSVGYVDSVDGTISSTIQTKRANNGVVISAPSFSNTNGL